MFRNYVCHRDGKPHPLVAEDQRLRRLKAQGSCKMGVSCPAGMESKETPAGIELTYFPRHLGHKPDREKDFIPLTEEDKARLAKAGRERRFIVL